jgi:uncharacterized protein YegP (UPF0339 family)
VKVHVYRDAAGKWRWRAVSQSDDIVADSGQGYVRRSYCAGMAKKRNPDAEIVFDEEAAGPAVTPDT